MLKFMEVREVQTWMPRKHEVTWDSDSKIEMCFFCFCSRGLSTMEQNLRQAGVDGKCAFVNMVTIGELEKELVIQTGKHK